MICSQCKKQIPDDSDKCSYCGFEINHKQQVSVEINSRRYQRWFFYALITFIFLGMVGIIVKVYNANNTLTSTNNIMEKTITEKDDEIQSAKTNLDQREQELNSVNAKLARREDELTDKDKKLQDKVDELKEEMRVISESKSEVLSNLSNLQQEAEQCTSNLSKANSNIYSLVVNLGIGVSNDDINMIPIADANLIGIDDDEDGLSNEVEIALGTDVDKQDTDGDGYTDKDELLKGYNPLGEGVYTVDSNFIEKHKGDILLQVDSSNEAWYIGGNGKKYFLGNPVDAFRSMRNVEYWTKQLPSN